MKILNPLIMRASAIAFTVPLSSEEWLTNTLGFWFISILRSWFQFRGSGSSHIGIGQDVINTEYEESDVFLNRLRRSLRQIGGLRIDVENFS